MFKKSLILFVFTAFIVACNSSDDSNNGGTSDNFDRSTVLANVADNIIIPSFQDLQSKLSEMDVARGNFINVKSVSNLELLSNAWLEAYKVWQHVEMFNIGEAQNLGGGEDRGFVSFFNIYPVDVSDIENAVSTGNYDLNTANYHDAQGFPALDFLIHGIASGDIAPIDKFTTNAKATAFGTYISDVTAQMITLNNRVLNSWESSYRDTFVANTQTGLNGSFNTIVSDYVFFYEKGFRAVKIGIPAGNFSATPLPESVEAFFKKDVSKLLALEAQTAIENLFKGKAYNASEIGASFKTYLEFLDRDDLVTALNAHFSSARTAINGLNDNFYQQVIDNNVQMTTAYDAIQAAVPKLKIDMVQQFGVTIDYFDSDGD